MKDKIIICEHAEQTSKLCGACPHRTIHTLSSIIKSGGESCVDNVCRYSLISGGTLYSYCIEIETYNPIKESKHE
jgi:hypothetical protein